MKAAHSTTQERLSVSSPYGTVAVEGDFMLETSLTTGAAPFVEEARNRGDLYITQPYQLYSDENHDTWRCLFARMQSRWQQFANDYFLSGLEALHLPAAHVPELSEINRYLQLLTGFQARPVSGYVPAFLFFDCLRRREFPTTITIRDKGRMDYLAEPDIFHDLAGHVPMHTNKAFAEVLVRFGDCAHSAVELTVEIRDQQERERCLLSVMRAMSRFFWFTIEFGLMRRMSGTCAYGSGLLSSYGELQHAVESDTVQRYPLQLEWVINQGFEIDHYQPLLFVVDSFDHLFELVDRFERRMRDGRLYNIAPGLPDISESDLRSFMKTENLVPVQ
jgi:phenylalanine-4-hydroxylase